MKAIGYAASLPISDARSLFDFDAPAPVPGARDLLVRVKAISVNPVDTKVRMRRQGTQAEPVILGWDAAGVVEAVGADVTLFRPGDEVYYAGSLTRPGTNAELHAVDERIVALKPKSLGFGEAAALPLTAITAWEALFDRLRLPVTKAGDGGVLLITGAAAGSAPSPCNWRAGSRPSPSSAPPPARKRRSGCGISAPTMSSTIRAPSRRR